MWIEDRVRVTPPESLTIRPAASAWPALVRRNSSSDATRIRAELGFAADRPIIMTGHQAELWHPGILAKYFAADAAAHALSAQPAWLVVDQDRADSVSVRYPTGTAGSLGAATAIVRDRSFIVTTPPHEICRATIERLASALAKHVESPLSRRIAGTMEDLLRPYLRLSAPTIFATDLHRTSLFQSLVDRMLNDPEACCRAYNAAAAHHPAAGIRALVADDVQDRWELPLWHLPPGKPRTHVYAEMFPSVPINELAPKALFMTALMRLAACDLFIHGTGGGGGDHEGYDTIMEEWLETWLGVPRSSLAPMAVVTATRYLPFNSDPPPSSNDVARAQWTSHHARHDPSLLHDSAAATAKAQLLERIRSAPRHSRGRADAFIELHRTLERTRRAHTPALESLAQRATLLASRLHEGDIIYDRTWPFAIYPAGVLTALKHAVDAEFAP